MPKKTYTQINSVTLAANSASVSFASIPQNFRDLILTHSSKHTYSGSISVRDTGIRFNGDSGNNYPRVNMWGTGSSAISEILATDNNVPLNYGMASADFQPGIVQIMDYSASDKHKTVLYRTGLGNDSNYGAYSQVSRWANTSAITSLIIIPNPAYQLISGSTFTLYGIEA
jgi:hypothetical protein